MAVEDPGDSPVISARYGRHRMSRTNATGFLPFFGTDIGKEVFISCGIYFCYTTSNISIKIAD